MGWTTYVYNDKDELGLRSVTLVILPVWKTDGHRMRVRVIHWNYALELSVEQGQVGQ